MEIQKSNRAEMINSLPFLKNAPPKIIDEFIENAVLQKFPAGKTIYWEGDQCHSLALLVSGTIRVYKVGESGREITLYRFGKGEGCILTMSSILNNIPFPAIAAVESDCEAFIVSAEIFRDWIDRYQMWRSFVCDLLAQRLAEIIATVEEIAFKKMDSRVAELLIEGRHKSLGVIKKTHQNIANELGTAREVVSRILKDFEMEKLISQSRAQITILDVKGLLKKVKQF